MPSVIERYDHLVFCDSGAKYILRARDRNYQKLTLRYFGRTITMFCQSIDVTESGITVIRIDGEVKQYAIPEFGYSIALQQALSASEVKNGAHCGVWNPWVREDQVEEDEILWS
jgi:hypothetical protein